MTNHLPADDSVNDHSPPTRFLPEPPESSDEQTVSRSEYPRRLTMEFDPLDLGGPVEDETESLAASRDSSLATSEESMALLTAELEAPEGYSPPRFDAALKSVEENTELDTVFAELTAAPLGQSADIAVWCPWISGASHH